MDRIRDGTRGGVSVGGRSPPSRWRLRSNGGGSGGAGGAGRVVGYDTSDESLGAAAAEKIAPRHQQQRRSPSMAPPPSSPPQPGGGHHHSSSSSGCDGSGGSHNHHHHGQQQLLRRKGGGSNPSFCTLHLSPPPSKTQMERSLAFKRWARGRCYRCLGHGHEVSTCQDSFRCIRCRRPGHKERNCRFLSPAATPRCCEPPTQSRHFQHSQSWADVVAMSPQGGTRDPLPASTTNDTIGGACAACGCLRHAGHGSHTTDMSELGSLLESLRSDLQEFIGSRLEEVMRPLRAEASTIKLWLARVSNHLECMELLSEDSLAGLFGPCSPVRRSPTPPSILTSLAAACRPSVSSVSGDTCANNTAFASDETATRISDAEIDKETKLVIDGAVDTDIHQKLAVQDFEEPSGASSTQMIDRLSPQAVTLAEDFVLVEDASDDEEIGSDVQETVKNPIFLITTEDHAPDSTVEAKVKEPRLIEDSPIEATPPLAATASKSEGIVCPSLLSTSSRTTTTRRRRKSYDKSSLRRSERLAQRYVLEDLGVVGNDGKFNEDVIQDFADRLHKVVPPNLLKPLMGLKGPAFWDLVAKVSLL